MRKKGKKRNKRSSTKRTIEAKKRGKNALSLLIILVIVVVAIAGGWYLLQPKSQSGSSSEVPPPSPPSTYTIMPSSWEVSENWGSYQNPVYAYDGNAETHADIDSPGRWNGTGERTLSESLVYTFQLGSGVTQGNLYYTWKTSVYIECATCRGKAKILYWNFETSTWDQIGRWEDQSQSTRKLNVPLEYISSNGTFEVKFLAESAWEGPYWSGTEIDLYETYVGVGE